MLIVEHENSIINNNHTRQSHNISNWSTLNDYLVITIANFPSVKTKADKCENLINNIFIMFDLLI